MVEIADAKTEFGEHLEVEAARLALSDAAAESSELLGRCREFLKVGTAKIRSVHDSGGGGRAVAAMRSDMMDVLIRHLLERTRLRWSRTHGRPRTPLTLLALGGYGRRELCPFSDIDLMFMYPTKVTDPEFKDMQAFFNDGILYLLWDLGLKVGHSTRNPKDAVQEARGEVQSKNAMLEGRYLAGDRGLAREFDRLYYRFIRRENILDYIDERLKDQRRRREKFGNTVFLQEPDIKNGVGGLRDFQNILWIVRLKLNTGISEPLLHEGLLDKSEQTQFTDAYDFLLRVRNELHFRSRRPTDLLDLEKQPIVALGLGWDDENIFSRVERFMRTYYRAAKTIFEMSHYLEQRLALDARTRISFMDVIEARKASVRRARIDVFSDGPGGLEMDHPGALAEDPVRMIRLFRVRQQLRTHLSLDLTRAVTSNLDLITPAVMNSPDANRAFRSILQARGEVAETLRDMHRTGVLGRFIPEWGELDCLVQHEYYQRYTADEHTLATIDHLDRIFLGKDAEATERYREALAHTEFPGLLYTVLLLHDIGKTRSLDGHAEEGAKMATGILERLDIPENLRERIVFLIRGQLEMARFWQHFDIDDPRTIRKFAEWVGDADNLRYLYVLTFCDSRGTAEQLWNSYKDSLHTQLFHVASEALGESTSGAFSMTSKDSILEKVPELSEDEIEAHYSFLPERYFLYSDADDVALHLRMVNRLLQTIAEADSLGSLVPVVEWAEDINLGLTVVHVVTWDRAGLFAKLAGAFSVAGLSIVSSKALTRADHITIDTFYVSDADGGVVRDSGARKMFTDALESALLHNKDLLPEIKAQASKRRRASYLRGNDRLQAPLPHAVEVYHEVSLRRTIIEIQATDAIGLLYQIARAIYERGFDITFARIATERNVAVDTFYIEPVSHSRESRTEDLLALRKELAQIVEDVSGVDPP